MNETVATADQLKVVPEMILFYHSLGHNATFNIL